MLSKQFSFRNGAVVATFAIIFYLTALKIEGLCRATNLSFTRKSLSPRLRGYQSRDWSWGSLMTLSFVSKARPHLSLFARKAITRTGISGILYGFNSFPVKYPRKSITTLPVSMSSSNEQHGTFANFLAYVQNTVSSHFEEGSASRSPCIQMIMGNEAGDADSIISALGLAHVNSMINSSQVSVPIISIPRADMSLRRDAVLILDLAGIDVTKLLFIDDDCVTSYLLTHDPSQEQKSITLVDHNRMRASLANLSSMVSEIVDHHEDENSHEHVTIDSGKRIVAFDNGFATVASTCTLVAERLFEAVDPTTKIDGGLGLALLGVILLDSVNMLPEAGKGTYRDEHAINSLLARTDWSTCANTFPSLVDSNTLEDIFPQGRTNVPDRKNLFDVLSNSKFDPNFWAQMSVTDCLRIDYKKFVVPGQSVVPSIGLSSVLLGMDNLLAKDNFTEELLAYVSSENVDLFGVLTLEFKDDRPQRELLIAGLKSEVVDSFANFLTKHHDAANLEVVERNVECFLTEAGKIDSTKFSIRVFCQGNSKGSRKQVAPILVAHASTISKL
mmetsp:Transcript_2410/g.4621  ORF Transcript_2410/g.4621 Transcript_2410/m.4621 type:complete len:558 (+) Transcript_2410:33-1706(+)